MALLLFRPVPLQTGSALVCTPGKMQHTLSHVLQQVRGRASSPSLVTTELALLPDNEWGENTFSSPTPPQNRHGWSMVSSPALSPLGCITYSPTRGSSALLCCPDKVRDLFSQVLLPVRGSTNFSTLMKPAQPPITGIKGQ